MTRPSWQAAAALVAAILLGAATIGAARADGPAAKGNPRQAVEALLGMVRQLPAEGAPPDNLRDAIIKAADKIIAASPDPMDRYTAVFYKTVVLSPKEAAAFEKDLGRLPDKLCAQVAHVGLLIAELKVAKEDPKALRKKIGEVKKFLAAGQPPPYASALAEDAAMLVEHLGDDNLTRRTFKSLRNSLGAMPMGQDSNAYRLMTGVLSRMELPGHEMELLGKTLDGRPFKLANLRGKVVLVQFWATWCGICMHEIQGIKQHYKKFHDKGFEVVGISEDDMPAAELAQFVKKEDMPWIICRDKDSMQSMGAKYGVRGIPVMILVGRDGNVLSLHARGDELESLVEKALAGTLAPEVAADVAADDDAPSVNDAAQSRAAKAKAKEKEEEKRKAEELAARKKKAEEARAARAPKLREWTDTSGSFHRTAKFRGLANGKVKLELEDGSVIRVSLEKLSDDDQKYIRQRTH